MKCTCTPIIQCAECEGTANPPVKTYINGRLTPKMRAEDIRHKGRLTDDQIADIPVQTVYMWVRCGDWKPKDFQRWLKVLRVIE